MRFFKSKNCKNYIMFNNETTSKSKVLPQRKNFELGVWNSTTLISSAINWTIISIRFPINKKRAHGSISSRFAGGYGSEFLAMGRGREFSIKQVLLEQSSLISQAGVKVKVKHFPLSRKLLGWTNILCYFCVGKIGIECDLNLNWCM